MAPHSSTPAWKITWTEEPGGLQSMGSLRVGQVSGTQEPVDEAGQRKRGEQEPRSGILV